MSSTARKRATYEDLLAVPERLITELIEGALHTAPRPSARHALASSALGGDLWGAFQRGRGGPGGRWILDEPELHLGQDVLVPDLAGWRRSRLPQIPDTPYFTLAPDWICEVLSPSTARVDRVLKLPIYAREGVKHIWLVDPAARTLEVFRLDGGGWRLLGAHGGADCVRAEPFEALELDLLLLWGEEREPAEE
jgi:Uma2 family endonuclease